MLPGNLPSSFHTRIGQVRYFVEVRECELTVSINEMNDRCNWPIRSRETVKLNTPTLRPALSETGSGIIVQRVTLWSMEFWILIRTYQHVIRWMQVITKTCVVGVANQGLFLQWYQATGNLLNFNKHFSNLITKYFEAHFQIWVRSWRAHWFQCRNWELE